MPKHTPRMKRRRLRLASSKWDRAASTLLDQIELAAQQGDVLVALTEVADGERPKALAEMAERRPKNLGTWKVLQDRTPWTRGEVALAYDTAELKLIDWTVEPIYPDLGPGLPGVGIVAVFQDRKTGLVFLVAHTHMPSAVEGILGSRARRWVAYTRGLIAFRRLIRSWRGKYDVDAAFVCADWNLSVLLKRVRAFMRATFPAFTIVWDRSGEGTHHGRQIDYWLVWLSPAFKRLLAAHKRRTGRRPKTKVEVQRPHGHSDHDAVVLTVPAPTWD